MFLDLLKHDLRVKKKESIYATSKASGLRAEIIKKLEDKDHKGSAESLIDYIESYLNRFPQDGYFLWYSVCCKMREIDMFSEK